MPELPEVETVRRDLAPVILGRRIESVAGPAAGPVRTLAGRKLSNLRRRGKYLIASAGQHDLVLHLGMSGRLFTTRAVTPAIRHLQLVIGLNGGAFLVFVDRRRFGRAILVPRDDYATIPTLRDMGPEPLSTDFSKKAFADAVLGSRASIKALLLGQRLVAGLGNIYTDEALHRARIHPASRSVSVEQAVRLHQSIKVILSTAIRHRGTSFSLHLDGLVPPGDFGRLLKVFRRRGLPCTHCGNPIALLRLGGRATFVCPRCQRAPRATTSGARNVT